MRKKNKSSFCQIDHLELRRLLSATLFVSASAPGPTHDGSSWVNAFTDLQTALTAAISGTTIEVGQGTYKPTAPSGRTATFQLVNGVTIQGGYAGTGQSTPDARNPALYPSILSGDIGTGGDNSDNSYTVVSASGTNSTAVLDGFTITGGNANATNGLGSYGGGILIINGSPTITDCVISGNTASDNGGGIYEFESSPTVTDCVISGNTTSDNGGGIYSYGGSPTVTDCVITGNSAKYGGGMYNYSVTGLTVTDCTITGNTVSLGGGGMFNRNTSATLINSIIAGNTAEGSGGIANFASMMTLTNCTITGNTATTFDGGGVYSHGGSTTLTNCVLWGDIAHIGENEIQIGPGAGISIADNDIDQADFVGVGNNIDADPLFIRNVGTNGPGDYGDLHLAAGSPSIDVGSNTAISGTTTDLDGEPRIFNSTVDLGAYERQIYYVDMQATGSNNGSSWANAFTDLQSALAVATDGSSVDVAQGTYYPTAGTDRTVSFQLIDGVIIQGGFAEGGSISADPTTNKIFLSGDIGTLGDNSDNSDSVVIASGTDASAILDGFTITGGENPNSGGAGIRMVNASPVIRNCVITLNQSINSIGGGVYSQSGSPALSNCTIRDNYAMTGGGGIYLTGGAPTLSNCVVMDNTTGGQGGGIHITDSATAEIIACTITGNRANSGGGITNYQATLTLTNSLITGNGSTDGGGIADDQANTTLINSVVSGNVAFLGAGFQEYKSTLDLLNSTVTGNSTFNANTGGGLYVYAGTLVATNSILWGNDAAFSGEIVESNDPVITITFSDVDQSGISGAGDFDADPEFVRNAGTNGTTDYGDLHLQPNSPAIDSGSNSAIAGTTTDLDGKPRIVNGTVDLGAYEHQILYVDLHATGSNNGSSWANAFTNLQGALAVVTPGSSIDVAQGTYFPTAGTNRTVSFRLIDDVTIEGGFAGDTGANPGLRNVSLYTTLLSGDIGSSNDNSDNSYNVVTGSNVNSTAVLDGFTITSGYANGSGDSHGAGIYLDSASPAINDCIITGNTALGDGGGLYGLECNATVTDCTFEGNTASNGGGVANCFYGGITLVNCAFAANSAAQGGGFYGQSSDNDLINCTFSDNAATSAGGAIFSTGAPVTVTNSILWADSPNEITMDQIPAVSQSDIDQDGFAGSNGNIDADPQFVRNVGTNGSSDFGDLHILGTSPAVNAGSNAAISGTTTDLDDNARIVAGTVDMGAYEAFATHLVIFAQPASTDTAGIDLPIIIRVEDQYGAIFSLDHSTIAIALANSPSGATLGGTSSLATQNGVATFNAFFLTKAGTYSLSFSNGSLPVATSNTFTITPAAPASLTIAQQPANTTADQSLSPIVVEVEDQYGNLVTSDASNVMLASAPAGASETVAANHGVAIFPDLSITTAGTYTLSASDGSLTGATSNSFTVTPGTATQLVFANAPAGQMAGAALPTFEVDVEDQNHNIITSDDSTITLSAPAGAGISGTLTAMAQNGVATFSGVSLTKAQSTTLTASDGSLASATASLDIIPADTVSLVFQQQPVSGTAGSSLGNIIVSIVDAYGNLAESIFNPTITLAIASGPSGAILSGTTTESTSSSATFSDLSLNQAGTYTLSASGEGLPTITSDSFTIAFSGPSLTFSTEPSSASAGAKLSVFTIETVDASGNLITTGKSKISLVLSSNGKLIGSANATVKNGKVTFSKLSIQKAGTYTLTASDPTFASAVSTTFTISAASGSKLLFNPQPANVSANTPFNVSVELLDKYSNAVDDGSTVDLVLGSHPKTATSLNLSATVSDGFADFDGITLGAAGNYTLKANDGKSKATSKKFVVS